MQDSQKDLKELLPNPNGIGVLVTIRRDGSPQVAPIGYHYQEDGRIFMTTRFGRAKVKNLQRDSRAALCVIDPRSPRDYVSIYSRVEMIQDTDYAISCRLRAPMAQSRGEGEFERFLRVYPRTVIALTPENVVMPPPYRVGGHSV